MVQKELQEWEIDPSQLIIKYVIARGTFGTVYRGIYDGQDVTSMSLFLPRQLQFQLFFFFVSIIFYCVFYLHCSYLAYSLEVLKIVQVIVLICNVIISVTVQSILLCWWVNWDSILQIRVYYM